MQARECNEKDINPYVYYNIQLYFTLYEESMERAPLCRRRRINGTSKPGAPLSLLILSVLAKALYCWGFVRGAFIRSTIIRHVRTTYKLILSWRDWRVCKTPLNAYTGTTDANLFYRSFFDQSIFVYVTQIFLYVCMCTCQREVLQSGDVTIDRSDGTMCTSSSNRRTFFQEFLFNFQLEPE